MCFLHIVSKSECDDSTYASNVGDLVQVVLQLVSLGLVEVVGAEGEVGVQLQASQSKLNHSVVSSITSLACD